MNQVLLYLKLEPYLAQWYVNKNGGSNPVNLPRGGSERDILEHFITTPAKDRTGEIHPSEANVQIVLPFFKGKDPKYYNYLPPKARALLERNIYVAFRCNLWQELYSLKNIEAPISDLIWSWMEKHGIEDDPKNWETIRQMFYRLRKAHSAKSPEL